MRPAGGVTVLAVGNLLYGDDGVGLAALDRLRHRLDDERADRIDLVDGGVLGLALGPLVEDTDRLIVLDAILGGEPGTIVRLDGDDVPLVLRRKPSMHDAGLIDVLTVAHLRGLRPTHVVMLGIVPTAIEWGIGLAAIVADRIDDLVDLTIIEIDRLLALDVPARA